MTTRKAAAKASVAIVAIAPKATKATKATKPAAKKPERAKKPLTPLQRADMIKRLVHPQATVESRRLMLTALTLGDVAAISGLLGKATASAYEVMAIKIADIHGPNWVALVKAIPSDLTDSQKTMRKQILATLEGIRETVKSSSGGNADKARETLRSVKAWGEGKRTSRQPKGNAKAPIKDFLKSWAALPSIYRRIMKDEGSQDAEMQLGDAIAAYFTAHNINPRAVLDCSGETAWG
jgi:hypothetical protein